MDKINIVKFDEALNPHQDPLYFLCGGNGTSIHGKELKKPNTKGWAKKANRFNMSEVLDHYKQKFPTGKHPLVIGMVVPKGTIVIDVDDRAQAVILKKIYDEQKLDYISLQTTKGTHFIFKEISECANVTNAAEKVTPIGITVDIRKAGKGYIVLPFTSELTRETYSTFFKSRYCDKVCKILSMDHIPKWSVPFNKMQKSDVLVKFPINEGGRNDRLNKMIWLLAKHKFNATEIKDTIKIIGRYTCSPILPQEEIDTLCRPDNIEKAMANAFSDEKQVGYKDISETLYTNYKMKCVGTTIYFKLGDVYTSDTNELNKIIITEYPNSTSTIRKEIVETIRAANYEAITDDDLDIIPHSINTVSGVVDLSTLKLVSAQDNEFRINQVPAKFDYAKFYKWIKEPQKQPDYLDKDVMKFLKWFSSDDPQIQNLILQVMAYSMMPTASYRKAFILLGSGSNGKSLFLDVLSSLVGVYNTTVLGFKHMNAQSKQLTEIEHKLLSIEQDISDQDIGDTSMFKSLTAGNDKITAARLYEQSRMFKPYATFVFGANSLPRFKNITNAVRDRLMVIPILNTVKDSDRDLNMKAKLTTPEAMQTWMSLIMLAGHKLVIANKFIDSELCMAMTNQWLGGSDTFSLWLTHIKNTQPNLNNGRDFVLWTQKYKKGGVVHGMTFADVHANYVEFCTKNGYDITVKSSPFTKRLMEQFPGIMRKRLRGYNVIRFNNE